MPSVAHISFACSAFSVVHHWGSRSLATRRRRRVPARPSSVGTLVVLMCMRELILHAVEDRAAAHQGLGQPQLWPSLLNLPLGSTLLSRISLPTRSSMLHFDLDTVHSLFAILATALRPPDSPRRGEEPRRRSGRQEGGTLDQELVQDEHRAKERLHTASSNTSSSSRMPRTIARRSSDWRRWFSLPRPCGNRRSPMWLCSVMGSSRAGAGAPGRGDASAAESCYG
jgi:hypothetical protein